MDKQKNRHQEKWQEEIIHSTEKAFNKDTHFYGNSHKEM